MQIKHGDVIRIMAAGAGGWGDPLERDFESVLNDVRMDKVSLERARGIYGVVINEDTMEVKSKETEKLREHMKKTR